MNENIIGDVRYIISRAPVVTGLVDGIESILTSQGFDRFYSNSPAVDGNAIYHDRLYARIEGTIFANYPPEHLSSNKPIATIEDVEQYLNGTLIYTSMSRNLQVKVDSAISNELEKNGIHFIDSQKLALIKK